MHRDRLARAGGLYRRDNPFSHLARLRGEFLAVDTRAPYTRDFAGAQGGKPAQYMLRWVNSKGETGPWSETVTATIGA